MNDQPWKERLIELQMMLEVGEISEEEYTREEAQVFQALRDIRARREEMARQTRGERGDEDERRDRHLHRIRPVTLAARRVRLARRRAASFSSAAKAASARRRSRSLAALHLAKSRQRRSSSRPIRPRISPTFLHGRADATRSARRDRALRRFLDRNLDSFLELGDRGTYLDQRRAAALLRAVAAGRRRADGVDAHRRAGGGESRRDDRRRHRADRPHAADALVRPSTSASSPRRSTSMQEKHRGMVRQFTRRDVARRDGRVHRAVRGRARAAPRAADRSARAAFVPVTLSEPWVVEQTKRLIAEMRDRRAVRDPEPHGAGCDCDVPNARERARDASVDARGRGGAERAVREAASDAPRSCRLPLATSGRATCRGVPANDHVLRRQGRRRQDHLSAVVRAAARGAEPEQAVRRSSPSIRRTRCATCSRTSRRRRTCSVEIDRHPRASGARFRDSSARRSSAPSDAITPSGMTVAYDTDAMQKLIEIAPPGADELFAITRLADLIADDSIAEIDRRHRADRPLPPPPRPAEDRRRVGARVHAHPPPLPRARSRPARSARSCCAPRERCTPLEETLHSDAAAVVVVTRPERIVVAETQRLIDELQRRGIRVGARHRELRHAGDRLHAATGRCAPSKRSRLARSARASRASSGATSSGHARRSAEPRDAALRHNAPQLRASVLYVYAITPRCGDAANARRSISRNTSRAAGRRCLRASTRR